MIVNMEMFTATMNYVVSTYIFVNTIKRDYYPRYPFELHVSSASSIRRRRRKEIHVRVQWSEERRKSRKKELFDDKDSVAAKAAHDTTSLNFTISGHVSRFAEEGARDPIGPRLNFGDFAASCECTAFYREKKAVTVYSVLLSRPYGILAHQRDTGFINVRALARELSIYYSFFKYPQRQKY
ncbi:unnamed protein product [Trichogramma brassicae]|uniref:Uncharacterized protein n=1 Tax=Trichogramma brassicae TaxID=86971 RepID=A0A6H5INL3_9HYME|nr:unnamed protein product [Trichogramma brassicae]